MAEKWVVYLVVEKVVMKAVLKVLQRVEGLVVLWVDTKAMNLVECWGDLKVD